MLVTWVMCLDLNLQSTKQLPNYLTLLLNQYRKKEVTFTSGRLARSVQSRQQSWKGGCRSLGDPGQGSITIMTNRDITGLLQTVADPLVPDMLNNLDVDMLIYSILLKLKDVSMLH